ncbi:MAG: hypothetical protein ACXWUX_09275 [Allosphingosinicella sp.]
MKRLIPFPFAAATAALALAGCVAAEGFPSLALRPAELDRSFEPPQRPAVEVPSDAALRGRIAELTAQAATGDRAFEAAIGPTEAAVRRAGPAASESWVEAQVALSRLEESRAPTTQAQGDLDALAIERAATPTNAGDLAAIDTAIAEAARIAEGQQAQIDRLRARLANA